MEFELLIDVAADVDEKYAAASFNACKEFLDMFPEYKDKFAIKMRYNGQIYDSKTGEKKKYFPTVSHLPEGLFNAEEFIKQADGSYLAPQSSMEWFEQYARRPDGNINNDKLSQTRCEYINDLLRTDKRIFHLGVTNKKLYNGKGTFGFGIGSPEIGTCISTSNFSEEKFKHLIWHEFGHVFKAVHTERDNTTDHPAYGTHCATKGCIMVDVAYGNDLSSAGACSEQFCNDCQSAMRQFLRREFRKRTPQNQTEITDKAQELPANRETDDSFKQPWREFAQNVATELGATYEEDKKETNYKATLKHQDGSRTQIEASSANNVALSAKDKDGNKTVPELEVFKKLVEKAQKEGQTINFGNISTPEFKARLLIACIESNPPIKTKNAPAVTDDFLNLIDNSSRCRLKILKNKQRELQVAERADVPQVPQQPALRRRETGGR